MAIIWKNDRWVDSLTGNPVSTPLNTRYDQGLPSERSNTLASFQGLSNMGLSNKANTPYNMPETEDRFSAAGLNTMGNASNFWKGEAEKLGYGKESSPFSKLFNSTNVGIFADLSKGAGDLIGAYSALKTNQILKKEMEANDLNSRANYAMGATSYNDQAEMRNQWLAAQGRDPLYTKAKTTY